MILLVCDKPKREFFILNQLKNKLLSIGIKSVIINKHLLIKAYNYYKPKIITITHCKRYFKNPITKLNKHVKIIMIPVEHSLLKDKFIDFEYFGPEELKNHSIYKLDKILTQSKHVNRFLRKRKVTKTKSIGHLYYNYWANAPKKVKKQKIKKIGIAINNKASIRYFRDKNYLKVLKNSNLYFDYISDLWRMNILSMDIYYYFLLFKLIDILSKKFHISIRPHPLDAETDWSDVFDSPNISISAEKVSYHWIEKQDVLISTFSSVFIDAYIFKKPHISLINMIPKSIMNFKAHNRFYWKEYSEWHSFKPNSLKELVNNIHKIKFSKNKIIEKKIYKYFSFPYVDLPIDLALDTLREIYLEKPKKFKALKYNSLIEKIFGYGIYLFLSEAKMYLLNPFNEYSYFSKKIRFLLYLPRKLKKIFDKYF